MKINGNMGDERQQTKTEKGNLNAFSLAGLGVGGIIGAGFFLGSGLAVREAGPSVTVSFLLAGLMMMQVLGAMTSINVNRLEPGSFRVYAEEFLGPYYGYLIGWAIFISSILAIGSESIAMGVFVHLWMPHVALPILATSFMVITILLNTMDMKYFGKIEAGMSAVKVFAILAFIVLGVYAILTGTDASFPYPLDSVHHFFPKGVSGLLQSMLVVVFSYSGISAVAMAGSDVSKPRVQIPQAAAYMSFGSIALYVLSMLALVKLTAWNTVSVSKSPFVHAFDVIGMHWAATSLNLVVILAAFSVMAASYYSSVQMVISLSKATMAPKLLLKETKRGFNRYAWLTVAVGVLIVVGMSFLLPKTLYNYLVSASSYITFLNWTVNIITYLVWKKKRRENETYESKLIWGKPGAYGSILAILLLFVMSLRVHDFRMGFFAAFSFFLIITLSYVIWSKRRKTEPKSY